MEIAHARVALSIAAQAGGDRAAARLFLDQARQTVRACPDPGPVITELLQRTESRSPASRRVTRRGTPPAAEFSEREIAVMQLLASRLSQREIGGALFISFNTV